jgi:hypothetical protein
VKEREALVCEERRLVRRDLVWEVHGGERDLRANWKPKRKENEISDRLVSGGGWLTQERVAFSRGVSKRDGKEGGFKGLRGAELREDRERVRAVVVRREEEREAHPRLMRERSRNRAIVVGKSERRESGPGRLGRSVSGVVYGWKGVQEDMVRWEDESGAHPWMRRRSKHRTLVTGENERSVGSPSGRVEAGGELERDVNAVDGKRLMRGVFLKRGVGSRLKQKEPRVRQQRAI